MKSEQNTVMRSVPIFSINKLKFQYQALGRKYNSYFQSVYYRQSIGRFSQTAADLSDRAYTDIERGTVNMRTETLLCICRALHIPPDELLTENSQSPAARQQKLFARPDACSPKETALRLPEVYLTSLD
jgi:hypothetical protein